MNCLKVFCKVCGWPLDIEVTNSNISDNDIKEDGFLVWPCEVCFKDFYEKNLLNVKTNQEK